MKNLFAVIVFCIAIFGSASAQISVSTVNTEAQKKGKGFVISGTIQGLGDGEVKITSLRGDQVLAAGKAKAGVFRIEGSVEEPGLHWINIGAEQPHYLFLENSPIKITGTKTDIKNIKIEGSASHKDFTVFEQTFNPLFANLNSLVGEINRAAEPKKAALMPKYNQALLNLHQQVEKFVAARRSSFVSLFALSATMQSNENVMEVEKNFNLLNESLKNSVMGKEIGSYISYAKVGAIGTEALDFTQNDLSDKPVSLSSFKGKYVLVDFWASWCKPCRMENPNVVKAYNKFKDKNFTVLGVSLDQQKDAWVKAVEKDKLTWTQVSDLQFWNNSAAQLYRVQSIPQNFLIDPNGRIVAKDLRGAELEKRLCEYLGCSN